MLVSTTHALAAPPRLAGQRVLVTGAGRGIGQAIATICARQGAKVAIAARTELDLHETQRQMRESTSNSDDCKEADVENSMISLHVTDVTNQQQVQEMVHSIVSQWGGIDILINNAGSSQRQKGSFEELDSEDLISLLNLNVVAVHRVTSAVVPHMTLEEGSSSTRTTAIAGRVINISSKAGKIGIPNMSFYVASKFALEGLTATMAAELQDRHIHVNSISPGMVNTQSFPKPDGKPGVRTAESIEDGILTILESGRTGHYLHVDELDMVRAERGGFDDDAMALKPINEPTFVVAAAALDDTK